MDGTLAESKSSLDPEMSKLLHNLLGLAKENENPQFCYSTGVMILSEKLPRYIHYRSVNPVLTPELLSELSRIIDNVVFPTGIDRRDDIGQPNRFDVYYGMVDSRIGVARLDFSRTAIKRYYSCGESEPDPD